MLLRRYIRSSVASCTFFSSLFLAETISTKASALLNNPTKMPKPPITMKASESETNHYDSLSSRVFSPGFRCLDPLVAIRKWKEDGHAVSKYELVPIIRELRRHKLYDKALLVCEWMTKQKDIEVVGGDYAVRLNLIAKSRGVIMAEYFFAVMPKEMKGELVFTALLLTYVQTKEFAKAESLMKKMAETGLLTLPAAFNIMIGMYLSTGRMDKAEEMIRKLKEHATADTDTYNLLLRICCLENDLETAETVVAGMNEGSIRTDWMTFCRLAKLYIENKRFLKASRALKIMEEKASLRRRNRLSFITLVSMHAKIGNKREILRIWKKMKLDFYPLRHTEYNGYMMALVKLGLFNRAMSLFKKKISVYKNPEIADILLAGYIDKEGMESAESFYGHVLERGIIPGYNTYVLMASGYLKDGQTKKGVDFFMKAMSHVRVWYSDNKLDEELIRRVYGNLEEDGDVNGAEEVLAALRNVGHVNTEIYNWVLKTYAKAGKMAHGMARRMMGDNVGLDEETRKLMELSNDLC